MVHLLAALARPSDDDSRMFTRACEDRTTPCSGGLYNHNQSGDQGGFCNFSGVYEGGGDTSPVDSDED
eukprot:4879437-Heterocapsa_arctica.AAC.1